MARRRLASARHLGLHAALHDADQSAPTRSAAQQGQSARQGASQKVGLLARRALARLSTRPHSHQLVTECVCVYVCVCAIGFHDQQ